MGDCCMCLSCARSSTAAVVGLWSWQWSFFMKKWVRTHCKALLALIGCCWLSIVAAWLMALSAVVRSSSSQFAWIWVKISTMVLRCKTHNAVTFKQLVPIGWNLRVCWVYGSSTRSLEHCLLIPLDCIERLVVVAVVRFVGGKFQNSGTATSCIW